jgi:hypothetical protein
VEEELLVDELDEELLEVLELDALLVEDVLDELDEELGVLLDEEEDEELGVLLDDDEELGAGELEEELPAPPPELLELSTGSGAVGVVVQPAIPAATTATGAPDSRSRKSRRRVSSETSVGAGAIGRGESDMRVSFVRRHDARRSRRWTYDVRSLPVLPLAPAEGAAGLRL